MSEFSEDVDQEYESSDNEMMENENDVQNMSLLQEKVVKIQKEMDGRFRQLEGAVERALGSMAPRVDALLQQLQKKTSNMEIPIRTEESISTLDLPEGFVSAAARGDVVAVRQLLEAGACVNERCTNGNTAIHSAAQEGWGEVAELLICAGADINMRIGKLHTPLHCAAMEGHSVVLQILLGEEPHLDLENVEGATALGLASAAGHKRIVQLLLKNGAKVDGSSSSKTPLLMAITAGHTEIAVLLLDHGANPKVIATNGQCALQLAVLSGSTEIVKRLLEKGVSPDSGNKPTALILAVSGRLPEIVKLLVNKAAALTETDGNGKPAVFLATSMGSIHVLEILLDNNNSAGIADSRGPCGNTALQVAIAEGNTEIAELLLNKKASSNNIPRCPLKIAAENGNYRIVKVLLHRFNWEILDERILEAVHVIKNPKVAWAMADGLPTRLWMKYVDRAIFSAITNDNTSVLEVLLQLVLDHNLIRNESGWTPLHIAAKEGRPEAIRLLLRRGADTSSTNNGFTALHLAAENGHCECLIQLLEYKELISKADNKGNTALHFAALKGSTQNVIALLAAGAEVFLKNHEGDTPLHFAARESHEEVIKVLLEAKASRLERNGKGNIPCDEAVSDVIRELLQHHE